MNRLVQVVDPFGQTVSNQYNLAGQRTKIVYPDGKSQTFAYDGASRLTNVQASAFGLSTTAYAYDSRNNLTGANLPGGLAVACSHDAANRRLAWSVSKGGSNLLARACERDSLGFRANETIAAGLDALAGAATQTRTHDAADQITGLTQSGPDATRAPSFDAAGNMTQLVASARGQIFTTRYSYDYLNRLTAVTRLRNAPDGSTVTTAVTQLEYDGQGLLLRITENGNVRRLVRDRTDSLARPLVEMDAMTNAIRQFVWANGKLLAQVAGNGTIRVAHSDELGRILALTDANGVLTDEYAYQPYGRLIAHSGTNDLPFAFMGDYGVWSAGNGLYLTRHRAYDANLMRFLQTDPIGLNGGYNLYAYANGAPSVFIDPLGLESRLNSAQQNIVNAANEWNATSPTWTPFNQCGQQAMALVTYLSGREEFSEWSFNILGGAVFGIENTYFTYGNHHVVEVRPAPWIKEDIGQPFTIDAFHEWYTIIPWIDWNTEVQVGSPDDFRETHPILFY